MNTFDRKLKDSGNHPLRAKKIDTLQVNMGYKCNLRCTHCHVEASPDRTEEMSSETVNSLLVVLKKHKEITTVDITGGSPELNPNYKSFVRSCTDIGKKVVVRSNLAILSEPGMENIPELWAENKVKVIASLPCYSEEGVDSQRGKGTYRKAIRALKRLNVLGYGKEGSVLELDIMFNPASAGIAPDQHGLENAYRQKLQENHGVTFNHLIVLSNMPIGRLKKSMSDQQQKEYIHQLEEKFNPATVANVMCRHLISVSPEGKLYDCDFWQMINVPVKVSSSRVEDFDINKLKNRDIVTLPLCLMCTAGAGTSCSGSLT
jgi:radical SAM/Cys-rich protein